MLPVRRPDRWRKAQSPPPVPPRRGRRHAGWCRTAPPCRRRDVFSSSLASRAKVVAVGRADLVGGQMRFRDHLLDRAVHEQHAIGDVGDLVTALGLVHVMGGDQHGQALRRQRVDLVPEFAPRFRIDAGGRLVEQQQLRAGQGAGAEREALLPAAGKLAGELLFAATEAKPLHHLARGRASDWQARKDARRIRDSPRTERSW